jgi:hypothetical protein
MDKMRSSYLRFEELDVWQDAMQLCRMDKDG